MPKGLQGFQKGHSGFKKHITEFCGIEGCNNEHEAKGLCKKHYNKQYQREHKKQIAIQVKKYAQINKERKNKQNKKYYQDNKKEIIEWQRKYRKTPAGRISIKIGHHNRRALEKGLTKEIIQQVYEDNIKKYGTLTCCLCFKWITFGDDSLEHLMPLSRGGTHCFGNLGVAHYSCNVKKHTMTLKEWFKTKKDKENVHRTTVA